MENGSANQSEEIPLISTTSPPVNQSKSQSAHSIKETPLQLSDDENALEINQNWQKLEVEGPPMSCDNPKKNENSVADAAGNEGKTETHFTFNQKFTLFTVAIASLANFMSFSILIVFFPIQAEVKGMSKTVIGLVFSAFALSSGVGSPICGKFIPLIGARFMFLAGFFLCGGANVLFGLLDDMPTETTFTVYCFIIRIVEGFGAAASVTASSAILAYTFPENVGTVVSVNELMIGLGFTLGPAVGGFLYDAGGYKLPFFILGGFNLLIVALNFFIMPQQGSKTEKMGSLMELLTIPAIWLALFITALGATSFGFLDPTLSIHLKELNFDVTQISIMLTILGGVYGLTSTLWGYIADRKKTTRIMIALGAFSCAVFFLFIGPSPLLKITPQKYIAGVSITFGAASISLLSMPALVDMFITSEWYGLSQSLGVTSVISGLWVSSLSSGLMLGPFIGGVLTEHLGFDNAGTVLAGVFVITTLLVCLFGVSEYRCGKGRRVPTTREVEP